MSTLLRLPSLALAAAVALSACAGTVGPTPGASTSCEPSASACASPSRPAAGPTDGSAALGDFGCPARMTTLVAPTNRLTGVAVTARTGYDEVAFSFGPGAAGSGAAPGVIVAPADPPFVEGASGLPLPVDGTHFVELTFRDMVVADETGTPSYAGPQSLTPGTPAVAQVVQAEAFEGVVRWIVGIRDPGCVRVAADPAGDRILLEVRAP